MLIQDNFTMPNAAPGYWYAGKLATTTTEGDSGKFYIYFTVNRDISDYIVDFYNLNDDGRFIVTTYTHDPANKRFTIAGQVFDSVGVPNAGGQIMLVDYLIFVSAKSLVNTVGDKNDYGEVYAVIEDLVNPKL